MLNDQPLSRITSYVGFVVITTLGIELAGAALMYSLWHPSVGWEERIGLSLFHSVSAFCNAGFSLFSDSLEGYRYSPVTHLVIMPLIVLGGLGFPVLENGFRVVRWRWRRWSDRSQGLLRRPSGELSENRLSLHTKLVLATTAGLYFAGVFGFAAAQLSPRIYAWSQQGSAAHAVAAKPLTAGDCAGVLADSSFMSITARTAGFNSVPMQEIKPAGRFTLMALMMVGASPGGTGGGMKTTTLALILLAIAAAVRQRARVELFHRTLTDDLIRAAATLSMAFTAVVALGTFLLCLSETAPFEHIVFEVISAASTTGLSLGLTSHLTTFGKVVIIVMMFLGRVGPLALLGALLIRRQVSQGYMYPREAVLMG